MTAVACNDSTPVDICPRRSHSCGVGFFNRRRIKQRAAIVFAMREALSRGDFDAVIAGIESLPWASGSTLREWMLIEWFIRETPDFAQALWAKEQFLAGSPFHIWVPVLTELIEYGDLDPNNAIERAHWLGQMTRARLPFAIVQMLLRSRRRDEAVAVGARWLRDPLEVHALRIATTSGDEQRQALTGMETVLSAEPTNGESIILETCRALHDGELPFSLWSGGNGHSSLNSTLVQEVPRRAEARVSHALPHPLYQRRLRLLGVRCGKLLSASGQSRRRSSWFRHRSRRH